MVEITNVKGWLVYDDGSKTAIVININGLNISFSVYFTSTMPAGMYYVRVEYVIGGVQYYQTIPIRVTTGSDDSNGSGGCTTAGLGLAALALVGLLRKKRG